jgi:hypothetical protein
MKDYKKAIITTATTSIIIITKPKIQTKTASTN